MKMAKTNFKKNCERCSDCGYPMNGEVCQHCSLETYDADGYVRFSSKAVLDKTLNTLEGILIGIAIDRKLNAMETAELNAWCVAHNELSRKQPYRQLYDAIQSALSDNVLTLEERDDLLWLCQQLHRDGIYYKKITADLQKLQGIIHGILADDKITKEELEGLREWMLENEQLNTYYPYDEIFALLTAALEDGVLSNDEENLLKAFFSQFVDIQRDAACGETNKYLQQGVCALAPDIVVSDHTFCFTGKSKKSSRSDIAKVIESLGGEYWDAVTEKTDFLIIGNEGNPCWAFACYGRKVEKAVSLRKSGKNIVLVNEIDFWDCISD